MSEGSEQYRVVWPRGRRMVEIGAPAVRPAALEGKTVAFLWDYLFRGDEIFRILQAALTARFPGMRFLGHEVFGNTHSGDERKIVAGLPARLKSLEVDLAISGMGC